MTKLADLSARTNVLSTDRFYLTDAAGSTGADYSGSIGQIRTWVPVTDHGVLPANTAAANDTALIALRDVINADKTRHYDIYFPPGTYLYSNNRWLFGVGSVTILARGVIFQNTSSSAWTVNKQPLSNKDIFNDSGDIPEAANKTFVSGYKFNSSALFDTTITMTTSGEEANFAVGGRVLVHGFDQQASSYPPNLRYFQWNTVASVGSGTLTLTDPLKYVFRSTDWEDNSQTIDGSVIVTGKARIISLERANYYYPRFIEIIGGEWLANPNGAGNLFSLTAETLVMSGVKFPATGVPTENRTSTYFDCEFGGLEGDKICGTTKFVRCKINGAAQEFTGVNNFIMEDCSITKGRIISSARETAIRRCSIVASSGLTSGVLEAKQGWPSGSYIFEDNAVHHDGALQHIIGVGAAQSFTVGSAGSANEIQIAVGGTIKEDLIRRIGIGTYLYAANLSDGGRITNITNDGVNWIIAGTWKSAPSGSWKFYAAHRFQESGTIQFGGERKIFNHARALQLAGSDAVGPARVRMGAAFPFSTGSDQRDVLGYVTKIVARVISVYTGSDATPQLTVVLNDGTSDTTYINMDLLATNYAETRVDATYAPSAPTTLTQLVAGTKSLYVAVKALNAGSPLSGSAYQMPKFSVYLEVQPLEG